MYQHLHSLYVVLFISVENLTAVAGINCDGLIISWFLKGGSFMLSQLNFTITLINSEIPVTQNFNVSGSDCTDMSLQGVNCGNNLTLFYYGITSLQANQSYTVSLLTHVDNMHNVTNSSHTTTANTTIPGMNEALPLIVVLYHLHNLYHMRMHMVHTYHKYLYM